MFRGNGAVIFSENFQLFQVFGCSRFGGRRRLDKRKHRMKGVGVVHMWIFQPTWRQSSLRLKILDSFSHQRHPGSSGTWEVAGQLEGARRLLPVFLLCFPGGGHLAGDTVRYNLPASGALLYLLPFHLEAPGQR